MRPVISKVLRAVATAYRTIRVMAPAVLGLTLASCLHDAGSNVPHSSASGNDVAFVVSVPLSGAVATRAITGGSDADNAVNEVTVMLFDPSTLAYLQSVRTTALIPVDGSDGDRWTVRVKIPDGSYKALVLANAAAVIDGVYDLDAGTVAGGGDMSVLDMDDVEGALKREFTGRYNAWPGTEGYVPFVMSSAREDLTVPFPAGTDWSANPMPLSRDVAKINIRVARSFEGDFTLQEIRLCNYTTGSYAVPAPSWWDDPSPLFAVSGVTRSATSTTGVENSMVYDNIDPLRPAIVPQEDVEILESNPEKEYYQCVDVIFTPERPATAADNLCLLVKASNVRDDVTGGYLDDRWYKLELQAKDPGGNNEVKHVNILRNYSYTIEIGSVDHTGYDTPEEAYAHNAEGVETEIIATPEEGMNEIVYNNEYQLTVDKRELTFPESENSLPLRVFTDYDNGWYVYGIDWDGGETGWFTVTTNPMLPDGKAGTSSANASGTSTPATVALATPNTTGVPREGYLILAAGTLRKVIPVTEVL